MSIETAMIPDELQLARLVCKRLGGMMQGCLSVGLACVNSNSIVDFLRNQKETHAAYITVLESTAVKPGFGHFASAIQEKTVLLERCSKTFFDGFHDIAQHRNGNSESVRQHWGGKIISAYESFYHHLENLGKILELNEDYRVAKERGLEMLEGWMELLDQHAPH